MLLILATCAFLLLYAITYYMTNLSYTAKLINAFPGPKTWPIVGNLPLAFGKIEDVQKLAQSEIAKCGTYMRLWIGTKPYIFVADGHIVDKVLGSSENVTKSEAYSAFHRILKDSLLTGPAEKWRKDRKNIARGFQSKQHEGFFNIFNEQSKKLMNLLTKVAETEENKKAGQHILPYFNRATLDSVFQTTFGSVQDAQGHPELEIVEKLRAVVASTRVKLLKPYLNFSIIWKLFGYYKMEEVAISNLMKYTEPILAEKKKERMKTGDVKGTHTRPFLAYIMDYTDNPIEIAYQTNGLSFGGAETSATAMNYLLFLLSLHPECQRKIIEEIDDIIGPDKERGIEMEDLRGLVYTEMCIKEALRLFPPIPTFARTITSPVLLDDGKIIPVGTQVAVLAFEVHRNSKVYPEPEIFIPERFDGTEKIPPGWWIPFSYGPRNCIGIPYGMIQMKTLVIHFFKNFTVKTSTLKEELTFIYGLVLEHNPPIKLILTPRTK